jgi:hypothetical protein
VEEWNKISSFFILGCNFLVESRTEGCFFPAIFGYFLAHVSVTSEVHDHKQKTSINFKIKGMGLITAIRIINKQKTIENLSLRRVRILQQKQD